MQIAASITSSSTSAQYVGKTSNLEEKAGKTADAVQNLSLETNTPNTEKPLQLSSRTDAPTIARMATATYAEIWKDGQKVAEIDLYGGVTAQNSIVAPTASSPGGGPQLAARRASQIAVAIDGEIRSAGQVVDRQTLLMRARLQNAYGI